MANEDFVNVSVIGCLIGVILLPAGLWGYLIGRINLFARPLLFVAGVLFLTPPGPLWGVSIGLILVIVISQLLARKLTKATPI